MDTGPARDSHESNKRASSEQSQRGRILQIDDIFH